MKISVVGLGFVGLSLASVLASKGFNVIGLDVDVIKCKKISNGIVPFYEPDLKQVLKNGLKKNLEINNNFLSIKNSDIIFITVGTPQKSNGAIELTIIKKAIASVGKIISKSKKNNYDNNI